MQERRQPRIGVSTTGRTLALLLLAVSLALGMAIVVWSARSKPPRVEPPPPAPVEEPRRGASLSKSAEEALESRSAPAEAATEPSPARFEGRGTVRGEVVVQGGAAMPERWTLVLDPHPWLEGSEEAEPRRLEFEHGETSFAVEDLPLGGYLVRAVAPDLNDVPASVLLVQGSPDQFVTLALRPGGFVDGGVLDAEGRPAEGLDVTLESQETRRRSTVSTDAAGNFLFRGVQDGEYEILFGRPDSPILPREKVGFRAPSLRFPTRTLPATGSLKLSVVDLDLEPLPRVRVSGSATGIGAFDVFADHLGRASARYLLPGHYVVDAVSEDGLEGHASFDLAGGEEREVQIILRERKPPR